jgi:hypothetical protein
MGNDIRESGGEITRVDVGPLTIMVGDGKLVLGIQGLGAVSIGSGGACAVSASGKGACT